jgi:excisionase family DNA binding protein
METLKLYRIKDISEMLRVTPRTVINYIQTGKLKGTKIGGGWRIKAEDFQYFTGLSA